MPSRREIFGRQPRPNILDISRSLRGVPSGFRRVENQFAFEAHGFTDRLRATSRIVTSLATADIHDLG